MSNSNSLCTLIFDFDGTIADSFTPTVQILATDFKKWGDRFNKVETIKDLRSMSIAEVVQAIPGGWWKFTFLLLKAKLYLKKHPRQVIAYPGIVYVLRTLYQQGYPLYIVTSNNRHFVRHFLRHYNLEDVFLDIIPTKGLFNKKKTLEKVLQQKNLPPKHTFYIGDEIRDILASHQAGLKIISVTYGFNSLAGLKRYHPDFLVKKPIQLLDLVKTLVCPASKPTS